MLRTISATVLLVALLHAAASAQDPSATALQQQIDRLAAGQEALRKQVLALQQQLQEVTKLLQARPVQAPAQAVAAPAVGRTVNIANAAFKGRADAPLTMIEFSDFQCPFCARHFAQTLPAMTKEYIDTGRLKYVFKHFPLESIHPLAFKASEAAECANDQGKFWPMHDRLFANQKLLAPLNLPVHAAGVGLDATAFNECLSSGRHAAKLRRDLADGKALGVSGTPAFALGRTIPGSTAVRVEIFTSGAKAYATFKQDIDRLLGPAAQ